MGRPYSRHSPIAITETIVGDILFCFYVKMVREIKSFYLCNTRNEFFYWSQEDTKGDISMKNIIPGF